MKMNVRILSVAALGLVLAGCQTPEGNPNNTGSGALIGGAIGALSGAVLGGRHAGEGALIGNSVDQDQARRLRAQAPQTYEHIQQGNPLGLGDIKALAQSGVGDDVI